MTTPNLPCSSLAAPDHGGAGDFAALVARLADEHTTPARARWLADACLVLQRVLPRVYEDAYSPIRAAGYDQPVLPASGPPRAPHGDVEATRVWQAVCVTIETGNILLPPAYQVALTPGQLRPVLVLVGRVRHVACHWHAQPADRATNFGPVLDDVAFQFARLIDHTLYGWLYPATIGVGACKDAGRAAGCQVSPVYAKGWCYRCYRAHWRGAQR